MEATPTDNTLPLRLADFATLSEALDYAAQGQTGYNFYSGLGKLYAALPYAKLHRDAQKLARQLLSLGLERGSRVALVAESYPDFPRFFFACQYAGLVPVPLPASIHLGGHFAFVAQLKRLLAISQSEIAIAPAGFLRFLEEAAEGLELRFLGTPESFADVPEKEIELRPTELDEIAYLQYTSGSTRFPRGVVITQKQVMTNLEAICRHGVQVRPGDRCVSWLPYYHDMGLVGMVLAPLASQLSVDYLSTRDFAMRPRQWLALITRHQATISFGPPFGFELCVRRLRESEIDKYDLSTWRVAGVGAETIRPEPLIEFAKMLEPSGFNSKAFLPCYGMAECTLAVSFAPAEQGMELDYVDSEHLAEYREALSVDGPSGNGSDRVKGFVNCGKPLPGYEVEVRNFLDQVVPDRHCGTLHVKGPSVMSGYFGDSEATESTLSDDGWLNTGDIGYRVGEDIVITGREKDMIIVNGRNIWPQDLEYLAELQREIRTGDASAFAVPGADKEEKAVMVIQCREADEAKRAELLDRLQSIIYQEIGIDCFIELVPPHTLPRTTSGKLSRSRARKDFLNRMQTEYWPISGLGSLLQSESQAG
ncbi:MAG: fatty acyl-AMP ligase [Desulfobacterales bacterium]|nr:fatty acyl-AMP ligase [Desulfobacterales bacterium]